MPDIDLENLSQTSESQTHRAPACEGDTSCCRESSLNSLDHEVSPHHEAAGRTDGGGEPCPTPLMWQEVREGFLRQSTPWEIARGPHRMSGRTLGSGPPLYFLNNFAATAELFSLTVWLLQDKFRCIVFDTTTDDRRTARRTRPTIGEFSADLFAVADHLGDEQFPVYGAGFGAAVAMQAAIERPERLTHLILQHGFAKRRLSFFERMLASICLSSRQSLDQLPQRRRFQAVNHKPWFPPFDLSRFDFLIHSTGDLPLRDLARRALAVHSYDIVARLNAITCPVTLLRTEGEGRLAADAQVALEQGLMQPKTEWMHSAGQHPYLTHPHRVAKIIQIRLSD